MFRNSYPALVACLEEVKKLYFNGTSTQKKKAENAEDILNAIYSIKFTLSLAVLCDIYAIYSKISVLLQKVSTLPHIRYDQFIELVEDYKEMSEHVDIELCPCSTFREIQSGVYSISEELKEEAALVCSWPKFHNDIATLQDTGKILHVIQGQLVADPLKDTRVGKRKREAISLLDQESIIKIVERRATEVVNHLSGGLMEKVYREEDKKVIKNTRIVLSSKSLVNSVVARGAPAVFSLTWDKFLKSSVEVDPTLTQRVSEEEYKLQYREYLRRLESLAQQQEKKDLSDMQLLEFFLKPGNKPFYRDLEGIMSVMVRSSLMISVESVVESWISTMEHHASQRRTLGEMHLH